MKIAIIGAGISGIAAARILNKAGHETVVFEKSSEVGGVWAVGYPGVGLQNTVDQYALADFPWPFKPDFHPTGAQIRKYLNMAVTAMKLDIRRDHEVVGMEETGHGWLLRYNNGTDKAGEEFDFVVSAIGQYTEGKHRPVFRDQHLFVGEVITERDVDTLEIFRGRETVVVGFGKSAVDMATFAAPLARQVHHVYRTPRWLLPFRIFGIHYTRLMFCRLATAIMPCWEQPSRFERLLHTRFNGLVRSLWYILSRVVILQCMLHGVLRGRASRRRLRALIPKHPVYRDMRSAAALTPVGYYRLVAEGRIAPCHAGLSHFSAGAVHLDDGSTITCDQVLLCVGSEKPSFPYFPHKYRQILESEADGIQLYRHILHPDIPNTAFAGYNHGFMHVPAAEVGMIWLSAWLAGDIELPGREEMLDCINHVRDWKRQHINFEPSRSCAVNTRFQQYLDIMLLELGLSPYRKMPNLLAEVFIQYGAGDYHGIYEEYRLKSRTGRHTLPYRT